MSRTSSSTSGSRTDRLIDRFTDWFTSPHAFLQGLAVTAVWLALLPFGVDPHGWWLLFWFTVFSGITQFPLAYAARRAADKADEAARANERLLRNSSDTMKALLALMEQMEANVEEILEDASGPD